MAISDIRNIEERKNAKCAEETKVDDNLYRSLIATRDEWDIPFGEENIPSEPDLTNIVVVIGLPQVKPDRIGKLEAVVRKKFSRYGEIEETGIEFLKDQDNDDSTNGVGLITFTERSSAFSATEFTKFDKKHTVQVIILEEFSRLTDSIKRVNKMSAQKNINYFGHNTDSRQRCQYVVREESNTVVYWNDPVRAALSGRDKYLDFEEDKHADKNSEFTPNRILKNQKITNTLVKWSETGTYLLAVDDKKNLVVYAGTPLEKVQSIEEKELINFSISPKENYVVTKTSRKYCNIWNIITGEMLCSVKSDAKQSSTGLLKWSYDDSFFAVTFKDSLRVYETKTMSRIISERQPLPSAEAFSFSPDANVLALYYHSSESSATSKCALKRTQILLVALPSFEVLTMHSYSEPMRIFFCWSQSFLVARVVSFSKTLKPKGVSFDFFDYRQPGFKGERFMFSDQLRKEKNERGGHFPLVTCMESSPVNNMLAVGYLFKKHYNVWVYRVGRRTERVAVLENEMVNSVYWSPRDETVVAVGLTTNSETCNGLLIFYDCATQKEISRPSHFNCNFASWSPCGRYFLTAILKKTSLPSNRMPSYSYNIYNATGDTLVTYRSIALLQFSWRPSAIKFTAEDRAEALKILSEKVEDIKQIDEEVKRKNMSREMKQRELLAINYRNIMDLIAVLEKTQRREMGELISDLMDDSEREAFALVTEKAEEEQITEGANTESKDETVEVKEEEEESDERF